MNKPLRVATLFPNINITGAGLRMMNFSRAVDPKVIDYEFIVIGRSAERDRKHGSLREQCAEANVKIVDLDVAPWDERLAHLHILSVIPGLWKLARTVWRIARTLRKEKIELVECHGHTPIVLGTMAAILSRTPYVVTAYDTQFWDRPVWRPFARTIFFLQRAMITDSLQRAELINAWLWRRLPTYVVPNGIIEPVARRSREEVCRELGIPLDGNFKIVGQVSVIKPDKGHAIVVDAAAEVIRRHPNTIFVLCGYVGPRVPVDFVEQLKATAARQRFADRLFIFPYPGHIGDIYQLFDIQVHGSLVDSSPISIHEGMSLGKPIVATREGGIPELITDEESGLLVPKNDPQQLAAAISRLLEDPATAARFGAAARKEFERHHRAETMARDMERAFLTIAGRPSDASAMAK
jgi:glycosyltransferase involved in cell wall biosynthesis